jgi:hypothetical protein
VGTRIWNPKTAVTSEKVKSRRLGTAVQGKRGVDIGVGCGKEVKRADWRA